VGRSAWSGWAVVTVSALVGTAGMIVPAAAQGKAAPTCPLSVITNNANQVSEGGPVEMSVFVDTCDYGEVDASAGGATHGLGAIAQLPVGTKRGIFTFTPCSLPGGSDLPGAHVNVSMKAVSPSTGTVDPSGDGPVTITLGDDTAAPELEVHSTPRQGSKVKAGDKISVKITATESKQAGTWQTGVHSIQLSATNAGGLVDSKDYGSRPKACAEKTWTETLTAKPYTVPANPPPIIHLQAVTEDYQGNQATVGADFPTGDEWTGTLHIISGAGGETCGVALNGTLTLVVGSKGAVQGNYVASETAVAIGCRAEGGGAFNAAVSGQLIGNAFHLTFTSAESFFQAGFAPSDAVVPLSSPKTATAQLQGSAGDGVTWTETYHLRCTTC